VIYQPFKHIEENEMYASWTFLVVFDEKPEVKVNQEEHSIYKWCDFEDVPGLRFEVMNDIKYRAIESAIMAHNMKCGGFSETAFFSIGG
jgi:hypothetical protein